jgi:uncharacterized membrane protein
LRGGILREGRILRRSGGRLKGRSFRGEGALRRDFKGKQEFAEEGVEKRGSLRGRKFVGEKF